MTTTIKQKLNISDFAIGDQFTIKSKFYGNGKKVFTVIRVHDGAIATNDTDGHFDCFYFEQGDLDFYADKIRVTLKTQLAKKSEATDTQKLGLALLGGVKEFKKVYKELHGEAGRIFRGKAKAEAELKLNDTVKFENGVLTFVSRHSGKSRYVTVFGCDLSCDCKGDKAAYHYQMYLLCAGRSNVVFGDFTAAEKFSLREAA